MRLQLKSVSAAGAQLSCPLSSSTHLSLWGALRVQKKGREERSWEHQTWCGSSVSCLLRSCTCSGLCQTCTFCLSTDMLPGYYCVLSIPSEIWTSVLLVWAEGQRQFFKELHQWVGFYHIYKPLYLEIINHLLFPNGKMVTLRLCLFPHDVAEFGLVQNMWWLECVCFVFLTGQDCREKIKVKTIIKL